MPIKIHTHEGQAIDANFISFSGGERHVQLGPIPATPEVTLTAHLHSSDDIMDLLLVRNALLAEYGQEQALCIEIPYLPYARQDRVCAPGQAFSLQVIAQLLGQSAQQRIVTWDCHSAVGLELTGGQNVTAATIIQHSNALMAEFAESNSVLIAPDKGARERCTDIAEAVAEKLGRAVPLVTCDKSRDPATGRIDGYDVGAADLAGKTAIITDDICDGGATFILLANALRQRGVARVILYVTHGIFSNGLSVFDGLIDQIYTTTSFPAPTKTTVPVEVIAFQR